MVASHEAPHTQNSMEGAKSGGHERTAGGGGGGGGGGGCGCCPCFWAQDSPGRGGHREPPATQPQRIEAEQKAKQAQQDADIEKLTARHQQLQTETTTKFQEVDEQISAAEKRPEQFEPNAQVELHSLQALQNNGKEGRLVSYDTEAGRWMLEMEDGDLHKLKPANLRLVQLPSSTQCHGEALEPEEVDLQDFEEVALQDLSGEEECQVHASGQAVVIDRPVSSHDGAVVMHAAPQLEINGAEFRMQEERPMTPPHDGNLHKETASRVQALDGTWVDCSTIELVLQQGVPSMSQCIVVTHWTSRDIACLITLRSAAGSPGLALDHEGLDLASRSGSEASTVMSARSCAMFRKGLSQALERTNAHLLVLGVQVKRFQILREDFTLANGLLFGDGSLNRQGILDRYRHLVDDMFQHETHHPHKWMQPERILAEGESGHRAQTPQQGLNGHSQHQSHDRTSNPSISGYQQFNVGSESGTSTPRSHAHKPSQHGNFSREPSPRQYSREASPRYARDASPRLRKSQQQRLPESVRALTMDGTVGNASARDRGRYSPTFAAAQASVRPFDASAATPSIIPVGRGPLGLPVGGANFDGLARTCTIGNVAGRPPRPHGAPAGGKQSVQGNPRGQNQKRPTTPENAYHSSAYRDSEQVAFQNSEGEWAF